MPFIASTKCLVSRPTDQFDEYGERVPSSVTYELAIGVVTLDLEAQQTSVRADSSASRGNAEERVTKARFLFPAKFEPQIGDEVLVHGIKTRVVSVFPRFFVLRNKVDHYQVDAERVMD